MTAVRRLLADLVPFNPARLAGNAALYSLQGSPSDSTFLVDGSNRIQLIADRSGNSAEVLLACNGTAGATFTNGTSLGTSDFTVSALVRIGSLSAAAGIVGAGANGFTLYVDTDGKVGFAKRTVAAAKFSNVLSIHTLYHIVYVRSGTSAILYINNTQDAGSPLTDSNNYTGTQASVAQSDASNNLWIGTLQRPAIYNRALSAAEVAALYAASGAPAAADYNNATNTTLVSSWTADNGSPTIVSATAVTFSATEFQRVRSALTLVSGTKYRISGTATGVSGKIRTWTSVATPQEITSDGAFSFEVVAAFSGSGFVFFDNNSGTGAATLTSLSVIPLGLLAYWDFSTGVKCPVSGTVTDTSGNSCVLTTSTGAYIAGARDLYQGTAEKQAIYSIGSDGVPIATFDGSNDYMKSAPFPLVQPESVYLTGAQVTWTINDYIHDGFGLDSMVVYQGTTTPTVYNYAGVTAARLNDWLIGVRGVVAATFNTTDSRIGVNRNSRIGPNNAGGGNANGFTIGADANGSKNANLTLTELLVRSVADDANTQARIAQYYMRKYAIAS